LVLSGGAAGNRGFTAVENDLSMTGELFADPNAATYARGSVTTERVLIVYIRSLNSWPRA